MVHLPFIPFIIRNKVLWNSEYSVSIDLPIQKPLSVSCLRNIILPFAIGWNTKSSKPASASRLCSPRWWQQDLTASEQKLQERMERRVFIKTRVPMRKTSTFAWQSILRWSWSWTVRFMQKFCRMKPLILTLEIFEKLSLSTVSSKNFLVYRYHVEHCDDVRDAKTSFWRKTLKTLLLSLAVSDFGLGLFAQAIYTFPLVNWLKLVSKLQRIPSM